MESWQIQQRLALPLDIKIELSKQRIKQWYEYWNGNVYVAFSGGKDSTVLLNLVRSLYPEVPAVFSNTGLEFPEIVKFVRTFDNVVYIRPKHNFKWVIERFGYPVISKEIAGKIYDIRNTKNEKFRKLRLYGNDKGNGKISEKWKFLLNAPFKISDTCCRILKKEPFSRYEKESSRKGILGNKILDSRLRYSAYMNHQCNNYESCRPLSFPLSFWTDNDIWNYIKEYNLPYSEIYNKGYRSTGCYLCLFGIHMEKEPNRIQRLHDTHPKLYDYCMKKLEYEKIMKYLRIPYKPYGRQCTL